MRKWHPADIITINRLVQFAISRKDPYLAERVIEMGRKHKVETNAETLTLQMDYRMSINDVDGALVAYKHLQAKDLSAEEDVPAVNKLIRALCATGRHDFDTIMNVAADLTDRRVHFEPDTVSTLAILHLGRREFEDVLSLLNAHVFRYSTAEIASVRDALVEYCVKPSTGTTQAWDTYTLIRHVFKELDRERRTQLMQDFFRRERPDMAVHVFDDMRRSTRDDTVANTETYIACLVGAARARDPESLEAVHNQLKLDYSIEPGTRIRNALMLAYTACEGGARRATAFWDEIASGREGPSLSSVHLVLRACEKAPFGDKKARAIWKQLEGMGMDFDAPLWASYMGALVGNGNVEAALSELQAAAAKRAVVVDGFM